MGLGYKNRASNKQRNGLWKTSLGPINLGLQIGNIHLYPSLFTSTLAHQAMVWWHTNPRLKLAQGPTLMGFKPINYHLLHPFSSPISPCPSIIFSGSSLDYHKKSPLLSSPSSIQGSYTYPLYSQIMMLHFPSFSLHFSISHDILVVIYNRSYQIIMCLYLQVWID